MSGSGSLARSTAEGTETEREVLHLVTDQGELISADEGTLEETPQAGVQTYSIP